MNGWVNEWYFRPQFHTVRLYCAEDNLAYHVIETKHQMATLALGQNKYSCTQVYMQNHEEITFYYPSKLNTGQ